MHYLGCILDGSGWRPICINRQQAMKQDNTFVLPTIWQWFDIKIIQLSIKCPSGHMKNYLKNNNFLRMCDMLEIVIYGCSTHSIVVFVCVRGLCKSLWMICLLPSSAPVDPYRWLLSTFSTCWMSRLCSTVSQTLRPSTFGKPTGS